ncbi:MAG: AAA family ATPase [Planctomycetota bacterium]
MSRIRTVKWWQFHHALLRYKFIVAAIVILGTFGAIFYTSRIPKQYRASASDMVDSFSTAANQDYSGNSAADLSRAHKVLAESNPVRNRAYELSGLPVERAGQATFEARVDGLLINFNVIDGDYNTAKKLANAWSTAFIAELEFRASSSVKNMEIFYNDKYKDYQKQWQDATQNMSKFYSETGFNAERFGADPIHATVSGYKKKMLETESALGTLDYELKMVKDRQNDPATLILLTYITTDVTFLERLKAVKDADTALSKTKVTFREGQEWRTAEDVLAQAKKLLDDSRTHLLGAMTLKREELKDEYAKAEERYKEERKKLDTLTSHQGRYNSLNFEIDSAKRGVDQITERLHESKIVDRANGSKVIKWEEAQDIANPIPFKPNWQQNIITGLLMSFAAACALVFALEQIDDTVRTPRDIEQRLGAVVLGAVPACGRKSMDREGYFLAKQQTGSIAVDSLRGIHIGLEVSRKNASPGNGALVITITSSVPQDGKSFITSNLGILFASLGRRVLVVDADLRKASLSKALGADDQAGFFEIVKSQKWDPKIVVRGKTHGYDLLAAGHIRDSISESLHPENVGVLIEQMRKEFDVIIFDTPPVLALPDACVLGQLSDVTLLVTRSRHTRLAQVERGAASLLGAKVKELVFVVNGLDASDAATDTYGSAYGYGYGYGSGYGYGYGKGYGRDEKPGTKNGGPIAKPPLPPMHDDDDIDENDDEIEDVK